ncbi:MAG: alpha/beta hydrolase [Clostridia bacterium]
MKILFIHGWFHSSKIYQKLADILDCKESLLVDLPGFGENKYEYDVENIEIEHIKYIQKILRENNIDVAIAHSFGCRILLKSLENKDEFKNIKCILLNPVYGKNKYIKNLGNREKLVYPLIKNICEAPNYLTDLPVKIGCLFTINKWECIDDVVLESVYKSDPRVATKILDIMATTEFYTDKSRVLNEIHMIYSTKDRAICKECFKNLEKDLNPMVYVFENSGHTLVLEDFNRLVNVIQEILDINKKTDKNYV